MKILFIPGNSQSTDTFINQLTSSILSEYQLSVFDLEAEVNALNKPMPQTFFFSLKDRLVELHQEHKFDFIVGHSWGGHLLIESITEMEGVKGIMTFGTPFMSKPPKMEASFLPNPLIPLFYTKELTNEQKTQLASSCCYNKSWVDHIVNGMSKSSGVIRELTPGAIGTGSYIDEVNVVETLGLPLAIIHGEKDSMVNPEYYKLLNIPCLWRGEVQYVSDAGHFPQLENADAFNKTLIKFVQEV